MQRTPTAVIICLIFVVLTAGFLPQEALPSKKKSKTGATVRNSKKPLNTAAKAKKKRKSKTAATPRVQLLSDTTLAPGVRLTNFLFGRQRHNVFALEMSVDEPEIELCVVKSLDDAGGLERVIDMTRRLDSCCGRAAVAAVNANFWRAYRNRTIGPLVVAGEVVQMLPYKQWSCAFFDAKGRMTIDRFTMSGTLKQRGGALPVAAVNHRSDSLGVCLYNRFSGGEIPSVSEKSVAQAFEEMRQNSLMLGDDSTEAPLDEEALKNEIARAQLEADGEFNLVKAQAHYLGRPMINRPFRCVIDTLARGRITIPDGGCVLSFGLDIPPDAIPRTGDTVTLLFSTTPNSSQPYEWAVSGTPRLVRAGIAKHEAAAEGATSRRFIRKNLARTAIGTDKNRTKNIIVVVQADNEKGRGATLAQMAAVMKQAGAWNAMNLDGGGSTRMIAAGRNVFNGDTSSAGRRVAAALGIFLKNRRHTGGGSK